MTDSALNFKTVASLFLQNALRIKFLTEKDFESLSFLAVDRVLRANTEFEIDSAESTQTNPSHESLICDSCYSNVPDSSGGWVDSARCVGTDSIPESRLKLFSSTGHEQQTAPFYRRIGQCFNLPQYQRLFSEYKCAFQQTESADRDVLTNDRLSRFEKCRVSSHFAEPHNENSYLSYPMPLQEYFCLKRKCAAASMQSSSAGADCR